MCMLISWSLKYSALGVPTVVQWVKNPSQWVVSLQRCGFDPCPAQWVKGSGITTAVA